MEPRPTNPPPKRTRKREVAEWIERARPARIGEAEWEKLLSLLAPISENYLRRLLRESGIPLTPVVEGVRQESFDVLESSLSRLLAEYEPADAAMKKRIRSLVISAKDHARLAARSEEKRLEKEEMALWMLTWLENPPLFPQWVRLRRAALGGS